MKGYEMIQPKLLIGLDNLRLAVPLKVREGGPRDPIAAKCRLGWSIYGSVGETSPPRAVVHFHVAAAAHSDSQLNDQLRDYFALEDAGIRGFSETLESVEEQRAREIKLLGAQSVDLKSDFCGEKIILNFQTAIQWLFDA